MITFGRTALRTIPPSLAEARCDDKPNFRPAHRIEFPHWGFALTRDEGVMHRNLAAIIITTSIGIALGASPSAFARGPGGGGGGGFGPGGPGFALHAGPGFGSTGLPPGFSNGHKTGWNGSATPPGWARGKKKGWNCTIGSIGCVPPGLHQP